MCAFKETQKVLNLYHALWDNQYLHKHVQTPCGRYFTNNHERFSNLRRLLNWTYVTERGITAV